MLKTDDSICLSDRRSESFPVRLQGKRTRIYHSKVFNMLGHVELLKGSGVDVLSLDLSLNNKNYTRKVRTHCPLSMNTNFLYMYIKGT